MQDLEQALKIGGGVLRVHDTYHMARNHALGALLHMIYPMRIPRLDCGS